MSWAEKNGAKMEYLKKKMETSLDSRGEFGEEIALLVFTFAGMLARNPFFHHHHSSTTFLSKAKLGTILLSVLTRLPNYTA